MTFAQGVIIALLVGSIRRIEARHAVRPQPWRDVAAEIIEMVLVLVGYSLAWWFVGGKL